MTWHINSKLGTNLGILRTECGYGEMLSSIYSNYFGQVLTGFQIIEIGYEGESNFIKLAEKTLKSVILMLKTLEFGSS